MNKIVVKNKDTYSVTAGIPSVEDVAAMQKLQVFDLMRSYSHEYLSKNNDNLAGYRWIKDAFNQWSRVYEYPYCYESIRANVEPGAHILDAGSGITFFPFFLNSAYKVTCVDQDDYECNYAKINVNQKTNVAFKRTSLTQIPYPDNSFDAIYCISVLEHTGEYEVIVNEFFRLLKPNGLLVVTFDLSLDGSDQGLNSNAAQGLIGSIGKRMNLEYNSSDLIHDLKSHDRYTTSYVKMSNKGHLLPWPERTLKSTVKNFVLGRKPVPFSNLTFCNVSAKKALS